MNKYGITKKLDDLGRIVLPIEYRKKLGLKAQDMTMVFLTDDGILIKQYEASCFLCHGTDDLMEIDEVVVCKKCLKRLNEVVKEEN